MVAARQAADAAHFNADKQRQEQQQQACETPLTPSERARLVCAVLRLQQQQTRTGNVPAYSEFRTRRPEVDTLIK